MNHNYQERIRNQFTCDQCGWSFNDQTDFFNHRRSRHDLILPGDADRGLSDKILDAVYKPRGINYTYRCPRCGLETCICNATNASNIAPGMEHITLVGKLDDFSKPIEIDTRYGRTLMVRGFLQDSTGRVKLTLWGDHARNAISGNVARIENAFAREFQNEVEVNVGWRAKIILSNSYAA